MSVPQPTIRTATVADVPALLELIQSAYRGEPSRVGWTTEADLLEGTRTDADLLSNNLADPATTILVAEDGDGLLACCAITERGGGTAYFGTLAVRPAAQGAGIGSQLLTAAEDHARAAGSVRMEMTVLAQRSELLAWYARRGYVPTGETHPFPYGDERYGRPLREDLVFAVLSTPLVPPDQGVESATNERGLASVRKAHSGYAFAQASGGDAERARLVLLENLRDAHTIRCLQAVGVSEGWRCLEVGAGAGSIARWLSEQVGPQGAVVATDLETEALTHLDGAGNVEVRCHDIVTDDLPKDSFDLVHTRFVLTHLSDRDRALDRIVDAVRPGGWVMVGDQDLRAGAPARHCEIFTRVWGAYLAALTRAGADIGYGARIPLALEDHGLVDVHASGESTYWRGGSPAGQFYRRGIERLSREMLATGLVRGSDIDEFSALLADPTFTWWSGTTWTGWGRKRAARHSNQRRAEPALCSSSPSGMPSSSVPASSGSVRPARTASS